MRLLFRRLGGIGLHRCFIQTAGGQLGTGIRERLGNFGVGLVFILGVGILALGVVVTLVTAKLRREASSAAKPSGRTPRTGRFRVASSFPRPVNAWPAPRTPGSRADA